MCVDSCWKLKTIFGTWSKRMRLTTWVPHQINKNSTCAECVHLEPLIRWQQRQQRRRQDTNYHILLLVYVCVCVLDLFSMCVHAGTNFYECDHRAHRERAHQTNAKRSEPIKTTTTNIIETRQPKVGEKVLNG